MSSSTFCNRSACRRARSCRKKLQRAVTLAALKLRKAEGPSLVLILLDADDDLPCELGPSLLEQFLELDDGEIADDPEERGLQKAWIERRFRALKYSETVDQPAMSAKLDLALCRRRSPSFEKLCRELEQRLGAD